MHKRQLHHLSRQLRWVSPWPFLMIAVVCSVLAVFALRTNNQEMIRLRERVYTADKAGRDVQAPLQDLQAYVTTHMNTNLSTDTGVYPPIQLKYTYERLVKERSDAASATNSRLYSEAQAYCEQQNPASVSGGNRIPCIQEYVQSRTIQQPAIDDALYKFAFTSPRWSPDLAGWSVLAAVVSGVLFVLIAALRLWLRTASR